MAIDADGRLFVTEWTADWVIAWGVELDGEGNVYVSAYVDNTVTKFRLLPPLGAEVATPIA